MIKLRFNNRRDELKFFLLLKVIQVFVDVPIRYAECFSDLDLPDGPDDPDKVD